ALRRPVPVRARSRRQPLPAARAAAGGHEARPGLVRPALAGTVTPDLWLLTDSTRTGTSAHRRGLPQSERQAQGFGVRAVHWVAASHALESAVSTGLRFQRCNSWDKTDR